METFDEKMHRLSLALADDALASDAGPDFRLDAFKILGNYQVAHKRVTAKNPDEDEPGDFNALKRSIQEASNGA
jgi:hypothetical protein